MKRTPFYDAHLAAGAKMVEFAGHEMPIQYVGLKKEHLQVRASAGLFDVSHMGEVFVRGPRALEALQGLLSNDVSACQIGEAQYAAICNHAGGVVDDVFVYRLGEHDFMVCVNAGNRDKDFAWFCEHNPCADGVTFTDEGDNWAQLAVQGPKAEACLQPLTESPLSSIKRRHFVQATVGGVADCLVARTGYTGEDGFEIFILAEKAAPLWDALLEAGRPFGLLPIGLGARDTLRLEVRNCLYGHELSDEISPLQAGLGWITKLNKSGGFIGQEAITKRKLTDRYRLAGLVVNGKRIVREGMIVSRDGEEIGWVSSGTRSPSTQRSVFMAFLRKPNARPGTTVQVDVRGKTAEATVVKGSFLHYLKETP